MTGYPYEIYVDPQRCIYQKLGMARVEKFTDSGNAIQHSSINPVYYEMGMNRVCIFMYLANPSPHVKSGIFMGQMKSAWRAMTSPVFDFQGDLNQQGGAIIAGPGKLSLCLCTLTYILSLLPVHCVLFSFFLFTGTQVHFSHFDSNRLDHMPINWLLQLAGVQQTVDFSNKPKIIHV